MRIYKYSVDGNADGSEYAAVGCDPVAVEHARVQDKTWFELHPQRNHRLRKLVPGEFSEPPADVTRPPNFTIVRQIETGVRQRFPVSIYFVVGYGRLQIAYPMSGPEKESDIRQLLNSLYDGGSYD